MRHHDYHYDHDYNDYYYDHHYHNYQQKVQKQMSIPLTVSFLCCITQYLSCQ